MKVLIWGTGKLTKRYLNQKWVKIVDVVGFIESNPRQDSFMDKKIYHVEEVLHVNYDLILVCVMNDCHSIFNTCIQNQIPMKRVLFTSWHVYEEFDDSELEKLCPKNKLAEYFPQIENEMRNNLEQYKYIFDDGVLKKDLEDHALAGINDKDKVVVWIPVELLFSEDGSKAEVEDRTDAWTEHNRRWSDHPIIAFEPYRNLYTFFMKGTELPEKYCSWYQGLFTTRNKTLGLSDEELIEKRFREFKMMQREVNNQSDFFLKHPATAIWNDRGYFNLLDGHHRISFLYHSGFAKMPVCIFKDDYEKWKNTKAAEIVLEEILKQQRKEFYQPIPNPYFMNIHPHREEYNKSRLHHLIEYFGEKRYRGKKIIDIGANLGYFGQMFYRMGAEVTMIEYDPNHYNLMRKINDLFYTKATIETKAFEEFQDAGVFDVAIMLTVFYPYFSGNDKIRDAFVERLNHNVGEMLIWESGDQAEEEKQYLLNNTKFKHYDQICYTYATGKFREMGVFRVDNE